MLSRWRLLGLSAALILSAVGTTTSQPPVPSEQPGKLVCDGLLFAIASAQPEYYVGEPIRLQLTLQNRYDREMTLVYDLEHFEFYVKYEDEPYLLHLTPMQQILRVEDRVIPPTHFAPGQSVTTEALLLWNAETKQMGFTKPGRYHIQAFFGTQSSNEIEIRVVEPPEYAARTLKLLRDLGLERLLDPSDYPEELTAEKLESLAEFARENSLHPYDQHLWAWLEYHCRTLQEGIRAACDALFQQVTEQLIKTGRLPVQNQLQVGLQWALVTEPASITLELTEPWWAIKVVRPDGSEEILAQHLEPGKHSFMYTHTDLPGEYRVIGVTAEARFTRFGPPAPKTGCPPPPAPPLPTAEQIDFAVELAPIGTPTGPQIKSTVLAGEPIPLRILLRNRSADPIFGSFYLQPSAGFLRLFIMPEDRGAYSLPFYPQHYSSGVDMRAFMMGVTLVPGAELEETEFVQFKEPGIYRVQARLQVGLKRHWDGTYRPVVLDSRELQIHVLAPEGSEREAFDFLQDANALQALHPSNWVSSEILALLQFFKKYLQSEYAPWVESALSTSCRESKRYYPQEPVLCPQELLHNDLELQLEPLQRETLMGQPVELQLTVRNRSDRAWLGQIPLRFAEGLELQIIDPDGNERSYTPPVAAWVRPVRLLTGGGQFTMPLVVHYQIGSWYTPPGLAFDRPGEYRLRVKARIEPWRSSVIDKPELISNEVIVQVRAPAGGEKDAWEFLNRGGLEKYLTGDALFLPHGDVIVRELQEFLRLFPQSAYAPHVREGLQALCAFGVDAWLSCPPGPKAALRRLRREALSLSRNALVGRHSRRHCSRLCALRARRAARLGRGRPAHPKLARRALLGCAHCRDDLLHRRALDQRVCHAQSRAAPI